MPSRIDKAGHRPTKAFDYPVAEHWGESQNVQFRRWDSNRHHIADDAKIYTRNALVARSAHNTCAREWNGLPPEVRNLRNLVTFKRLQKKWLKSTVPIT